MTTTTRLAALIVLSAATSMTSLAQAATPAGYFQYSSIVGAGQTLTISRLPTTSAAGTTQYFDVVINFTINADGTVNTSPVVTSLHSPKLITYDFVAGYYTSQNSSPINVAGPGAGPGGQTMWSLAAATGGCTYPYSAVWYVGPLSSNPLEKRLKAAGLKQTPDFAYGIIGNGGCGSSWPANGLIGAAQVNNTLALYSFTANGVDKSMPQASEVFTLQN